MTLSTTGTIQGDNRAVDRCIVQIEEVSLPTTALSCTQLVGVGAHAKFTRIQELGEQAATQGPDCGGLVDSVVLIGAAGLECDSQHSYTEEATSASVYSV